MYQRTNVRNVPTYTEFAKTSATPVKSALFGDEPPTYRNLNTATPFESSQATTTAESSNNINIWYNPYAFSATNTAVLSEDEGSEVSSLPSFASLVVSSGHSTATPGIVLGSCPPNTFHHALWNQMELIRLPQSAPVDMFVPVTPYSLFIGQVRFETTAAELRWIIHRVSNVLLGNVEQRGHGCFVVYFRSAEDLEAVRQLHKRILFDHKGVWFAKTQQEVEVLLDYGMRVLPFLPRWSHLPRDCMTAEDTKLMPSVKIDKMPPAAEVANTSTMPLSAFVRGVRFTTPPPRFPPPPSYSTTMLATSSGPKGVIMMGRQ